MTDNDPIALESEPIDQPAKPAIRVRDVRRAFRSSAHEERVAALDAVSFQIEHGAWTAILGPNGSGKSTLLRILATLDRPDSGGTEVLGYSTVFESDAVRAHLGVVFQKPGLDPLLSVRENLRVQASLVGMSRSAFRERVEEVAAQLSIADLLRRRVGRISGGQRRRADLARALLTEPIVLLLDEPTAGLDVEARRSFMEALEGVRRQRPITIVMATHHMDEGDRADEVIMMSRGRVVAMGSPTELRRALSGSGVMVRTDRAHADMLEVAGLSVRHVGGRAIGSGDPEAVAAATAALVRASSESAFEVGPATLEDVYLAHAGAGAPDGEADE